jgi:hypothetical protein
MSPPKKRCGILPLKTHIGGPLTVESETEVSVRFKLKESD